MKQKAKEWLKRYLPAEILSVVATLLATWVVFSMTGNKVTTALAGTWGGNVAFFGYILFNDIFKTVRKCKKIVNDRYSWKHLLLNLRTLALEFGVAELIDSLLIRPALMYYFPIWLDDLTLGVLLAKVAADVTFYIPAIISYELNKKYLDK
jgi:hypothetical protein